MKRSTKDAHIKTFIALAIALRWLTYLRSAICRSEGYTEQLTDASRKVVSLVGDSFLSRDDVNDNMARVALRNLLSASAENVDRAERCLRDVGFPDPCTNLAVLCNSSPDIQDTWRSVSSALNVMSDILSTRMIEVAVALHHANELESAYDALTEHLRESGSTSEQTRELVAAVRNEITTRLKSMGVT